MAAFDLGQHETLPTKLEINPLINEAKDIVSKGAFISSITE
jgi:hypothetical protein